MGGPQNGLPHTAPITPPATAPTGPATTRPVPAPAAAPTMSACAVNGAAAIAASVAAVSTSLRIVFLLYIIAATPCFDVNIGVPSPRRERRAPRAGSSKTRIVFKRL